MLVELERKRGVVASNSATRPVAWYTLALKETPYASPATPATNCSERHYVHDRDWRAGVVLELETAPGSCLAQLVRIHVASPDDLAEVRPKQ